jgi:hypothetical protein
MSLSVRVVEHLAQLQNKVDEMAERAGVSAYDRLDLRTALAALPWQERRRLSLVLESARVGAETPELETAVGLMLELAGNVWADSPLPKREEAAVTQPWRPMLPSRYRR